VHEALVTWEPRIDVEDVAVTPEGAPPVVLMVELTYRVRATNARANLVYPFYLQEGPA
jgi:phage baseplate assembly protein W